MHSFGKDKAPGRARIHAWMNKFNNHGTVENLNKASKNRATHSGRKRVRDPTLIETVRQDVQSSPKRSTRKRAQSLDVSRMSHRRMLKDDLGVFTYRIQIKQQLTADDMRRRLVMASALMDKRVKQKFSV